MPRARTAFADFSIKPAADHPYRRGPKKSPTLPELDPALDPIEKQVRTIVADVYGVDFSQAAPDTAFLSLSDDELDVVESVMEVEEAFGIEIDEDTIDGFVTVADLIAVVRRRR